MTKSRYKKIKKKIFFIKIFSLYLYAIEQIVVIELCIVYDMYIKKIETQFFSYKILDNTK